MKINEDAELRMEMRQAASACVGVMRDMFLEIQKDPGKISRFLQAVEYHQRILEKMAEVETMDEEFSLLVSPPEITELPA